MAKQNYTQEDFARAILRCGIATCNQQLDYIMSNYLGGATIIDDDHGSFIVDDDRNNWQQVNKFHQAHKYLNNRFFFSEFNDVADSVIGQAYRLLGSGQDVYSLLKQSERCIDVCLNISPEFKAILNHYNENCDRVYKYYMNLVYEGKLSLKESKEKIKKYSPVLSGEKYEQFLIKNGYKGRYLEQAKYFVDIMNYQNTNARVIDFLDVYTMYHYYIYKKAICSRFFKLIKENPNMGRAKICYEYEKIIKEEINKHCEQMSCEKNAYFQRDKMSLTPKKMDVNKAKRLTMEVFKAPGEIKKMLIDRLETIINQSVGDGKKLEIKEIFINPQTKNNWAYIKNYNPNVRQGINTNIKSVLRAPQKVESFGNESTIVPNLPNITKARVVEVSKLRPFVSERTKREREKQREREERRKRQEELNNTHTQLSLFPDDNIKQ